MKTNLDRVLTRIGESYKDNISGNSRFYVEVDIGKEAEEMGYDDLKERYDGVEAVVPLEKPVRGMSVRIDGRTYVNYSQLESGVAVPGYVAKESGLARKPYKANDSMILFFA